MWLRYKGNSVRSLREMEKGSCGSIRDFLHVIVKKFSMWFSAESVLISTLVKRKLPRPGFQSMHLMYVFRRTVTAKHVQTIYELVQIWKNPSSISIPSSM